MEIAIKMEQGSSLLFHKMKTHNEKVEQIEETAELSELKAC